MLILNVAQLNVRGYEGGRSRGKGGGTQLHKEESRGRGMDREVDMKRNPPSVRFSPHLCEFQGWAD